MKVKKFRRGEIVKDSRGFEWKVLRTNIVGYYILLSYLGKRTKLQQNYVEKEMKLVLNK